MRKRITNNLALKILAFLIAAFLWLVVVNIDDPVDDKTFSNIPVQVTHEEVITDNNNTYQIVDNTQLRHSGRYWIRSGQRILLRQRT